MTARWTGGDGPTPAFLARLRTRVMAEVAAQSAGRPGHALSAAAGERDDQHGTSGGSAVQRPPVAAPHPPDPADHA